MPIVSLRVDHAIHVFDSSLHIQYALLNLDWIVHSDVTQDLVHLHLLVQLASYDEVKLVLTDAAIRIVVQKRDDLVQLMSG